MFTVSETESTENRSEVRKGRKGKYEKRGGGIFSLFLDSTFPREEENRK
jgi:hypothetical protein